MGLLLVVWLIASMLTMGIACFVSAMIFWAHPSQVTHHLMWFWYVHWTVMLGGLVRKVMPDIHIHHRDEIPQNQPYVLIANHYSWVDIVVLYATVYTQSQSFVFVMKRSLIKIPMIGIVCWGLGHPLLYRGRSRRKNLEILSAGAMKSRVYNHGILIFPEGTRYTKVDNPPEDYQCLLKPRTVGFQCVLKSIIDPSLSEDDISHTKVPVLDITLRYGDGEHGVWDFLCGKAGSVNVYSELHHVSPVEAKNWLLESWANKDKYLLAHQSQHEEAG